MTQVRPQLGWIALVFALIWVRQYPFFLADLDANPWQLIQDDGRHFIAWLRRLADPELFPGDPIADFFLSVTPLSYKLLYLPAFLFDIDIVRWHIEAVIPAAILLCLWSADRFATLFVSDPLPRAVIFFGLALELAAHNEGLPRNFAPSIVMLALYCHARRLRWQLACVMLFGANMYPAAALVAGCGLAVAEAFTALRDRRLDRGILLQLALAAGGGLIGLAAFAASSSGPAMTLAEARYLPIFQPQGRASYFFGEPFYNYSCGGRAFLLPWCGEGEWWWIGYPVTIAVIGLALWVLARRGTAWRLLFGLCVAGVIFHGLAIWLAFWLHLPSRHASNSVGFTWDFVWIAVPAIGLHLLVRRFGLRELLQRLLLAGLLAALAVENGLPVLQSMVYDRFPILSAALRQTPKDTLVAAVDTYADSIPSFGARSVYAALELAVPYRRDHYQLMEARVARLAVLYGETRRDAWLRAHAESGIDVYLVRDEGARDVSWARSWKANFPVAPADDGTTIFRTEPEATHACTIAEQDGHRLVNGACFAARITGD